MLPAKATVAASNGDATLAALPDGDTVSFTRLQAMIGLTRGNLISHLRKLEGARYVATVKTGDGPASLTTTMLTATGRRALETYTSALRDLIAGLSPGPRPSSVRAATDAVDGDV